VRTERPRIANFVVLVLLASVVGVFLEGAGFWLGTLLICAVTAYGAFTLMANVEPRGVPIEALVSPAAATFATVTLAHGVGFTAAVPVILAAGGVLLATTIVLEMRLLGPAEAADPLRQQQLVLLAVLLAFLCFSGTAASVYSGLLGPEAGAGVGGQEANLLVFVLVDAGIAFFLGYRLAASRSATVRAAAREAGTFAVVIAVAAALVRAIALPRLLAPALLAAVFYLWTGYRSASRAERRSNGWLWEYLALAGAAALAVAWNLLLR
jgi:hypothetical protein